MPADDEGVDRKINAWVRESPKQRAILQIAPHVNGVLVLYEKIKREEEWGSVKRALADRARKKRSMSA